MIYDLASEKIEYVGKTGITQCCIDGLLRYLQFDDPIKEAKVISYERNHAFILYTGERQNTIVVRAGFSSGYHGEGTGGFAYVLSMLQEYQIEIDEYDVSKKFFRRLNQSKLSFDDLKHLDTMHAILPVRIHDYIGEYGRDRARFERHLPIPIPLRLIDLRIRDLTIGFWTAPGDRISTGFRRLEDIVRKRCKSDLHGAKLFTRAFLKQDSTLEWEGLSSSEQVGRANLFISVYGSFRNPRAHCELDNEPEDLLSEFLMLNQLYRFEIKAAHRKRMEEPAVEK